VERLLEGVGRLTETALGAAGQREDDSPREHDAEASYVGVLEQVGDSAARPSAV
jgi:hypothetical protein